MRQRRRHHYRRTAYDARLRQITAALEELADSVLRAELVKIELPAHHGGALQALRQDGMPEQEP